MFTFVFSCTFPDYLSQKNIFHNDSICDKYSMCDKYFVVKYKVEQHQKIQTGDKTYQCCQSEKCFAWKGHLVIHDRTHTGDKLY